jgi:hypothetical protein
MRQNPPDEKPSGRLRLIYKLSQESFATKKKNPPEIGGSLQLLLLLTS